MRFLVSVSLNVVFLILALVNPAAAGGNAGGGGGALVCPAGHPANVWFEGKEYTAQLLEFYEAKVSTEIQDSRMHNPFKGLHKIVRASEPIERQIEAAVLKLKKINSQFDVLLNRRRFYEYKENVVIRDVSKSGRLILPPTDSLIRSVPIGCQIRGIGQFSDRFNDLEYDRDLLETMPLTDQAGFWMHESIYIVLRENEKSTDSIQTRVIVARLFSDNNWLSPHHFSQNSTFKFVCESKKDIYYSEDFYSYGVFYLQAIEEDPYSAMNRNYAEIQVSILTRNLPGNAQFALLNTIHDPIPIFNGTGGKNFKVNIAREYLDAIKMITKKGVVSRKLGIESACYGLNNSFEDFAIKECGPRPLSSSITSPMRLKSEKIGQYVLINDNRILLPTKEKGVFKFNGKIGVQINGVDIDEGIKPGDAGYPEFFCRAI